VPKNFGKRILFLKEWLGKNYRKLLTLQPSQPPPRIIHLSNTRVGVLPEVEEFLVVLYGFGCVALLFLDLGS